MNNRKLTGISSLIGILGILIFTGGGLIEARLMAGEIPAWAVYGTVGTSTIALVYLIKTIAPLLMVTVAVGGGYYVGRRVDFSDEYRRLIRTFAAGITFGVSIGWLVFTWSTITSIGDIPAIVPQRQATQMLVMDIVLPILTLSSVVGQVGLIVLVGMLAGCGLAQARKDPASPTTPTESDTGAIASSSQPTDTDSSKRHSQLPE